VEWSSDWPGALVSVVFVYPGEPRSGFWGAIFIGGALGQLKARSSNMDTLVASVRRALAYSAWAMLAVLEGMFISWKPPPSSRSLASGIGWRRASACGIERITTIVKFSRLRSRTAATQMHHEGCAPVAELNPAIWLC